MSASSRIFSFFWQRCQSVFLSLSRWWVTGKSHIKHLSINYCKHRNILTNLVAHLKTHVDSGLLSLLPIYLSTLSRLNALDCEVLRGAQVQMQARARWAEEDEKKRATIVISQR